MASAWRLVRTPRSTLTSSPSSSIAAALLASASALPARRFLQLHAHLLRTGLLSLTLTPATTTSAFLSLAAASLPSHRALAVLDHHLASPAALLPSTFQCNSILRTLSDPSEELRFLRRMRALGRRGNAFTLAILLKPRCAPIHAHQLHANAVTEGHIRDALPATSLLRCYANGGDEDGARRLFDEMPVRDTVAWNVLITCYAKNRRTKDALKLFEEMRGRERNAEPDDVTCILLLQACTSLGALDFRDMVWAYAEEHDYGGELKVRNLLIARYSRCGCVEKVYRVFCETPQKSVVSWSTMMSGLAANGFGKDAISAFEEMIRYVAPDEQTFTGVLSACSHSGLVDEGFRFFDMMRCDYQLKPNVRHYGCIVDLMGRAGLLDGAYELVAKEMRVASDATIWRTLLGACRIHGHVDLGERVISHLIELKAQQAGDYILLLNTYAAVGDCNKGKESALTYHSEKLAIAFALLVTPQHRPTRLAKIVSV
ncbi:uncharacterized protein C2845_PM17G02110 [Panicum miliaceum]|uniref:Pentatricopeptide repeat-containing protein n=1 Tax=Panicum miliaceum TaxID=4540 RepID=A0A3L6Q5A1_PANMI|nr:uncharacterized protein C2845_PM17G02110 [Panicum miliaceum]